MSIIISSGLSMTVYKPMDTRHYAEAHINLIDTLYKIIPQQIWDQKCKNTVLLTVFGFFLLIAIVP